MAEYILKDLLENLKQLQLPEIRKKYETTPNVSVYSKADLETTVNNAIRTFDETFAWNIGVDQLIGILRGVIGDANAKNGINSLMTQVASLDAQEKQIASALVALNPRQDRMYVREAPVVYQKDPDALVERMRIAKELSSNPESSSNVEVNIPIYIGTDSMVERLKELQLSIRRQKMVLRNKIAALNLNTKVTISDETVELLRKYRIIE